MTAEYRYTLHRQWDDATCSLPIVMLNPSTATDTEDDNTIRRCIEFAKRDGFGGIHVVNLFAVRATDPNELWDFLDPIGPDNDRTIAALAEACIRYKVPVLCAWGAHPMAQHRQWDVLNLLAGAETVCLGKTMAGRPRHPLYLRSDTPMVPFP